MGQRTPRRITEQLIAEPASNSSDDCHDERAGGSPSSIWLLISVSLVRTAGLEPARVLTQRILSLCRRVEKTQQLGAILRLCRQLLFKESRLGFRSHSPLASDKLPRAPQMI